MARVVKRVYGSMRELMPQKTELEPVPELRHVDSMSVHHKRASPQHVPEPPKLVHVDSMVRNQQAIPRVTERRMSSGLSSSMSQLMAPANHGAMALTSTVAHGAHVVSHGMVHGAHVVTHGVVHGAQAATHGVAQGARVVTHVLHRTSSDQAPPPKLTHVNSLELKAHLPPRNPLPRRASLPII
eukprot:CAMPEP_0204371382 /NCGR_PEP_ID=MMETSP0469-20131031/46463_1 /ASSEMBLY_ACC=CAM_ASM_000384 /TAXON_ID=2969 /ORGANISM="Oxyrrhis marina" /LENGTH=183 /DNA_ID=CAMNT_0051361483 /DNA_START=54 /DNA_END=602 /DNA_ORIENTATION=+